MPWNMERGLNMELTDKDLSTLTVSEPPEDVKKYSKYGDYVIEFTHNMPVIGYNDTIVELRALIRKQALDSLNVIYQMRREKPVAIQFWEDQSGKLMLKFGWFAWTDRKA